MTGERWTVVLRIDVVGAFIWVAVLGAVLLLAGIGAVCLVTH